MRNGFRSLVAVVCVAAGISNSAEFELAFDFGEVMVYSGEDTAWTMADSETSLALGDSILVEDGAEVTLGLSATEQLLIRGTSRLVIEANAPDAIVGLVEGQVFIARTEPYSLSSLTVRARECDFTAVGTAAAVKFTGAGNPTVAVLRGRIRIHAPSGEAVFVEAGTYGTYRVADRAFSRGDLSENAMSSLEAWSGMARGSPSGESEEDAAGDDAQTHAAVSTAEEQEPAPEVPDETAPEEEPARDDRKETSSRAAGAGESAPPEKPDKEKDADKEKPSYEISAANVTVDDAQWTRLAFGVDVPVWKFGIFFDLELFIDDKGNFSDKGWRFDEDNWMESVTRKIRYVRFGREEDPVFVKVGGLSSVTLGYGFIVDRFTNMLHYPDEKLLGLQFYLNDLTPIGLTLQTVVPDFMDFARDGGVVGTRLGIKPLKPTDIPIAKGITVAGTYAVDLNQYAPARDWELRSTGVGPLYETLIEEEGYDSSDADRLVGRGFENFERDDAAADLASIQAERRARRAEEAIGMVGGDVGVPLINTALLSLDVYGQAGLTMDHDDEGNDKARGWGVGAPGVAVKITRLWGRLEYRHVKGEFEPGYFGPYYLEERIVRDPVPTIREQTLDPNDLDGVFGTAGLNIADAFTIGASYHYMVGDKRDYVVNSTVVNRAASLDHRYEATGALGNLVLEKVPKLNRAEAYFYKANIWRSYHPITGEQDDFFEKTPSMYYGYRLGVEIAKGASIIWDTRYGFEYDPNAELVPNNNFTIETVVTF